jgi:putative membrane protein
VFALGLGLIASTPVRAALAPRSHRRSACYRAALVQFAQRGLDRAHERNGVLLYVSLTERYARVVADVGLDAHIPHAVWRGLIAELGAALRVGDASGALQSAAGRLGELLAPVYPATPGEERPQSKRFHVL